MQRFLARGEGIEPYYFWVEARHVTNDTYHAMFVGAAMGNRTPVLSLEGFSSTIELLPHLYCDFGYNNITFEESKLIFSEVILFMRGQLCRIFCMFALSDARGYKGVHQWIACTDQRNCILGGFILSKLRGEKLLDGIEYAHLILPAGD